MVALEMYTLGDGQHGHHEQYHCQRRKPYAFHHSFSLQRWRKHYACLAPRLNCVCRGPVRTIHNETGPEATEIKPKLGSFGRAQARVADFVLIAIRAVLCRMLSDFGRPEKRWPEWTDSGTSHSALHVGERRNHPRR